MRARIEWAPGDLRVGLSWRRKPEDGRLHVWLCVIPCVPLHLVFGRDRRILHAAPRAGRAPRPRHHARPRAYLH